MLNIIEEMGHLTAHTSTTRIKRSFRIRDGSILKKRNSRYRVTEVGFCKADDPADMALSLLCFRRRGSAWISSKYSLIDSNPPREDTKRSIITSCEATSPHQIFEEALMLKSFEMQRVRSKQKNAVRSRELVEIGGRIVGRRSVL